MTSLRSLIALVALASSLGLAACETVGRNLNNAGLTVERSRPDGR